MMMVKPVQKDACAPARGGRRDERAQVCLQLLAREHFESLVSRYQRHVSTLLYMVIGRGSDANYALHFLIKRENITFG